MSRENAQFGGNDYIVINPGSEAWEDKRAWQGCPTIARTKGGRLFAGWYTGGMFEPCIRNYNVLVSSDDGGEHWSHPVLAIYSDLQNKHRNIDVQLWVDNHNRLWVMWTHSPYYEDSVEATVRVPFACTYHNDFTQVEALICNDPDAEVLVWEKPRNVCNGFLRCKPIVRSNGDYVFPAYDWVHADKYMLRVSKDEGKSFVDISAADKPENKVFDETMVYEVGRRLYMMARTKRGYYLAAYTDDGVNWSEGYEYQKAPSTRFYIARLTTGQLVYVRNVSDTAREGMKVCISEDDGKTWPYEIVLDTRERVSYPDVAEGENGELYIVYDRERDNRCKLDRQTWVSQAAKEILLSKITVEDIYAGVLSAGSYVARVLSKAGIDFVEK